MRFYTALEQPSADFEERPAWGEALARVVEAHPALAGLLDFVSVDPTQTALAVGMVYPYEEDGADDLAELDLGPEEWFEPAAGLAVVRTALAAIRDRPESLAAAVYDPTLRPAEVLADLEVLEAALLLAGQHETRFHFRLDDSR